MGDPGRGINHLREGHGQIIRTDGTSLTDCKFYYENVPANVLFLTKSRVDFLMAAIHHDSLTPDTSYLIEMRLSNQDKDPFHTGAEVGGLSNYYFGPIAAEGVKAHERIIYPAVYDSTDVHFYYGPSGPRMAIVMRPGADPSEVKLSFAGQDSIHIDWQGALRVYLADRYVKLEQAIAYQVDGNGTVTPVNWLPQYVHEVGNVTVGFEYENYNPAWPLVFLAGYPAMPPPQGPGTTGNLGWSTHMPSAFGNELTSVEVDADGDPYSCGYFSYYYVPLQLGTTTSTINEPLLAESRCGMVIKFLKDTKQIRWGTYIGGVESGETRAHKLALYLGVDPALKHVFVTGSTNSDDFISAARVNTAYSGAFTEDHIGGDCRMWLAALRMGSGVRDWATTHGQPAPDRTWNTHGLAVTIDRNGRLAVGGMIAKGFNTDVPQFPLVTPAGAFSRALGDGFLVVFAPDFTIEWSTTLLEYSADARYGRINDMRTTTTDGDHRGLWLVGASIQGTSEPLELMPPPSGGYFQDVAGSLSAVILQVDLNNHQIAYCTRWGSPGTGAGSSALAVHETADYTYVAGFTQAFDLTTAECPPPPTGTLVLNSHTNQTTNSNQTSDGFILRFKNLSGYQLDYGSLYGGDRDDIILDVTGDGSGNVFFTGESRSSGGLSFNTPGDLYLQWPLTAVNKRDAFITGIRDLEYPALFWNSAFGGTNSDRGWGIAASPDEVYLCGTTGSGYFDDFPLLEWNTDPNDPNSSLDWYWDSSPSGLAAELIPWVTFYQAQDYDEFGIDAFIEGLNSFHDGFIASFNLNEDVAISDLAGTHLTASIEALPLADQSGYYLKFPSEDTWQINLYDASGRLIRRATVTGRTFIIGMADLGQGMYMLQATTVGIQIGSKLVRP
ncbi:MAG: T9SS type A sorting domain-containing protein [Flavobacteriales bacterium]|nr:T9SS type A sorting domain-containing protein [Flavobacteriales bacterium]